MDAIAYLWTAYADSENIASGAMMTLGNAGHGGIMVISTSDESFSFSLDYTYTAAGKYLSAAFAAVYTIAALF